VDCENQAIEQLRELLEKRVERDQPMRIMNVLPARDDSYEALFRETKLSRSLTQWTAGAPAGSARCAARNKARTCNRRRVPARIAVV
jgi:hypothetical protein